MANSKYNSSEYYKSILDEADKNENKSSLEQNNYNSALSAYNQKSYLEDTYSKASEELEKNLADQQRTAYFNNEKIMKYLPNNLKVNGLANNVGAVSQAYLDANNNYQNNLNTINNNYQTNKNTLEDTYLTNNLSVDESYNNALQTNESNYLNNLSAMQTLMDYTKADLDSYAEKYLDDYGIGYTEEGISKLKEYVAKQDLTDEIKNSLNAYIDENYNIATDEQKAEVEWKNKLINSYGVSSDDAGIDNETAGASVLGAGHVDSNKQGSAQYDYVQKVINYANTHTLKNGTVVNMNYGAGSADNYVYYNGRWYKTSVSADLNNKNFDSDVKKYTN